MTAVTACRINQDPAGNANSAPYSLKILDDVGFENYDTDAGLISDSELLLIENPISDNNDYRFSVFNNEGYKHIEPHIPDEINVLDSATVLGKDKRTCVFLCVDFLKEDSRYSLLVFDDASADPVRSIQLADCGVTDNNNVLNICACPAGYIVVFATNTVWIIDPEHPQETISKRIDKISDVSCCDNCIVVSSVGDDFGNSIYCLDYRLKEMYHCKLSSEIIGNEYKVIASDDKKITICGENGIFSFNRKSKEYSSLILFEQYAISDMICEGISGDGDIMLCANFDVSDDSDMGSFKWLKFTLVTDSEIWEDFDVCVLYDTGYTNESIFKIFGALYGYNTSVTYILNYGDVEELQYNGQADYLDTKKAEFIRNKADLYFIPAGNIFDSSTFSYNIPVPLYKCACCVYDSKSVNSAEDFAYRRLERISFDNLSGTYLPFAYHDDKEAIKEILYLNNNPEELTSEFKYIDTLDVEEYTYYAYLDYKFCGFPGEYKDSIYKEYLGVYYSNASAENNKKLSDFCEFLNSDEFSGLFNTNTWGIYTESYETNANIIEYNLELIDNGYINNDLFHVGIIGNDADSYKRGLLDVLDNAKTYPFSDSIISALFCEEMHAYIIGTEDSDTAADVFMQRVNRYLSENDSI